MSNEDQNQQQPPGRGASDLTRLLYAGTSTASDKAGEPFTMDMLKEAHELIKALAPKEAPADAFMVKGMTGLQIMKNDMLPENTVMVSKRLFDLIYESSSA
jgi:hypothetical protein